MKKGLVQSGSREVRSLRRQMLPDTVDTHVPGNWKKEGWSLGGGRGLASRASQGEWMGERRGQRGPGPGVRGEA